MYDPNDLIEVEIRGVGKVRTRLMTERHLMQFTRDTEVKEGQKLTLDLHHARLNGALAPFLADPHPQDLTLAQKLMVIDQLPWAITNAEIDRLKKASALPSDSATN
jgi:hypothetical protein